MPRHCWETKKTARREGRGATNLLHKSLQARDQVGCREQAPRIDPQRRKRQRVFLHRIAFVFKQHHHHRDGQQHLRDRPQEASQLPNQIEKRLPELARAHQRRPQRQRKCERPERHGISAKSVTVKMERAIEQRRRQPQFQPQIAWRRSRALAEYPAGHVRPQLARRQQNPGHRQRNVIPLEMERFLHQPRRDEDANRHRHQQQRTQEKQQARKGPESIRPPSARSAAYTPPRPVARRENNCAGSARTGR